MVSLVVAPAEPIAKACVDLRAVESIDADAARHVVQSAAIAEQPSLIGRIELPTLRIDAGLQVDAPVQRLKKRAAEGGEIVAIVGPVQLDPLALC